MGEPLLRLEGVSKKYCADLRRSLRYGASDMLAEFALRREARAQSLRPSEFWALDDVSFEVHPGESVGVLGRNGAGKSTLLRLIAGVTRPDRGQITVNGRIGALLSLGAGFSPTLTGRENILIEGTALGMSRRRLHSLVDEIVDFADLGAFIDAPVSTYSDGMRMRLGFSVARSMDAELLVLDEVLVVGDVGFRRRSVDHIRNFVADGGSLVFVTHEVFLVQAVCQTGIELHQGKLVAHGDVNDVINGYLDAIGDGPATAVTARIGGDDLSTSAEEPRGPEDTPTATAVTRPEIDPAPVVIESIEVRSLAGEPILSGDPVEILVRYEAREAVAGAFWGFAMWTMDRSVCLTNGITQDGDEAFPLERGRGLLRCVIQHLPFVSGTFQVSAAILDNRSKMPFAMKGWQDAAQHFTVEARDQPMATLQRTGQPMLRLLLEWDPPLPLEQTNGPSEAVDSIP